MIKKIKVMLIVGLVALGVVGCMSTGKSLKEVKEEVSSIILPKLEHLSTQIFDEYYIHLPNSLDEGRLNMYQSSIKEIEQLSNNLYEERDMDDAEIERIFRSIDELTDGLTVLNENLIDNLSTFERNMTSDSYNELINIIQRSENIYRGEEEKLKEAVNFK